MAPTDRQRKAFLENAAAARALGALEYTENGITVKWDGPPALPVPAREPVKERPERRPRPGRKLMVRNELDEALANRGLRLHDPEEDVG